MVRADLVRRQGDLGFSVQKEEMNYDSLKTKLLDENLNADNAYYIDVTRNKGVKDGHSYFKGAPVRGNATLKRLFAQIFTGDDAEKSLDYHADLNLYRS